MSVLKGTSCYLVGQMQYADGSQWRNWVKSILEPQGIQCFDPYHKPFVDDVDESSETRAHLLQQLEEGNYDFVAERLKKVRNFDLHLVDRSDFIIAYIDMAHGTCGSWEEIFQANASKKPIYATFAGGKKKAPLWMFGTIPHEYLFENLSEMISHILLINKGAIQPDPKRWRLLRPEYRRTV